MARIEWVKQRLENWALWKAREAGGGLGFYTQSSFLNEVDSSRYREARIPVDEVDASTTNEGIESLKPGREHLYDTLYQIYIHDAGIRAASISRGLAESTIKSHLDQADHYLAAWMGERKRRQDESRKVMAASARKSFTT